MPDVVLSMEVEKKPGIEEGCQTSEGVHVQAYNQIINDEASWFKSLTDSLPVDNMEMEKAAALSQGSKPRIQGTTFKTVAEVFFLSPVCYNRINDQWRREEGGETNRRLAARFINDYNLEESICAKMLKDIDKFRQYYQDEGIYYYGDRKRVYYEDEELSRMFIVDGCALLFYIACYMFDDLHKLGFQDDTLDTASRDIFMLENQLPYGVLELLMERSKLGKEMPFLIHDFIESNSPVPGIETSKLRGYKPHHLLDILRTRMTGVDPLPRPNFVRQFSKATHSYPISNVPTKNQERKKGPIKWSPSHTVKDLKAAWIRLIPGTALTQISFRPGIVSGEFELPRLTIDESTQVKLLNLIDYEMCPDFENDLAVTSYICFLHSFVANVEDVAELRSAGVLINYLSSNEEVLKLFSEITSGLVSNPAVYRAIQKEIQEHFDRKGRTTIATWFAEAAQVYFKTPWSTITVLAATFAIILSVVQTYFAIFPRK